MNSTHRMESSYDAIVVGARVAGAATALLLARAGWRVLAVDRSPYGSDTLSTHALMRAGVTQLHRWGVLGRIVEAGTPAIRKVSFHYPDETVEIDIKPRDGVDALYAPRRTVIDAALADAARESGAHVMHQTTVKEILCDGSGRACGVLLLDGDGNSHRVSAGMVIGADGVRSQVARAFAAPVLHEGAHPAACMYAYWRGLETEGTQWYFAPGAAAGVIPTNDDQCCVFVGLRPERFAAHSVADFQRLFLEVAADCDPLLHGALSGGEQLSRIHSFAGRPGFVRQSLGPGWALVGDAGAFKDPLTAHGMTDALRDAELLTRAIIAGGCDADAGYQVERDSFANEFLDLSDDIASFDWDIERLKALHHRLSKLMGRENDWVQSWGDVPQGLAFEPVPVRQGS